ncbi:hypothetical protein BC829DRAFT_75236 [Chytridium lagenaria]|nr:hypothetical protein BC829DRAFT_75236 [Chytridium lagenaria]
MVSSFMAIPSGIANHFCLDEVDVANNGSVPLNFAGDGEGWAKELQDLLNSLDVCPGALPDVEPVLQQGNTCAPNTHSSVLTAGTNYPIPCQASAPVYRPLVPVLRPPAHVYLPPPLSLPLPQPAPVYRAPPPPVNRQIGSPVHQAPAPPVHQIPTPVYQDSNASDVDELWKEIFGVDLPQASTNPSSLLASSMVEADDDLMSSLLSTSLKTIPQSQPASMKSAGEQPARPSSPLQTNSSQPPYKAFIDQVRATVLKDVEKSIKSTKS